MDEGTSQWSVMCGEMEQELPPLAEQLLQCLAAEPWGDGVEGMAFKVKHLSDDGPAELAARCKRLPKEFVDAGARVSKGIDNLLTTDVQGAYDMERGGRSHQV
ncbi:hypothetical protein [Nonomuraea dietziae]|uniref:hypothetical protein n=1 Tax=Nonomuraea dietziae TaxID=65515 RepID=UPI0033C5749F